MDLNAIPEVLSSLDGLDSKLLSGPFKKTAIFGQKRQSDDLFKFEWPSAKEL